MSRTLGYVWAAPVTACGLVLAGLIRLSGGTVTRRGGVIEASGGVAGRFLRRGAAACLGHVILARDAECLERSREHEMFHVRQFERGGPLLLPAYWLTAAWLRLRGYDPYLDHPLEPSVEEDGSA